MEVDRFWCASWTSNPVGGVKSVPGGFDSHAPPPLVFKSRLFTPYSSYYFLLFFNGQLCLKRIQLFNKHINPTKCYRSYILFPTFHVDSLQLLTYPSPYIYQKPFLTHSCHRRTLYTVLKIKSFLKLIS